MPFKTILAVIGATDAASDIQAAIELARELDAHLSIVVAGVALPPTGGDFPIGTAWLDQRYDDMQVLDDVAKKAQVACEANGLSFETDQIYAEVGILDGEIFRHAIYADVTFIGSGGRGDSRLTKSILTGTVFDARRPLLLAPRSGKATLRPKNILLAWNSRAEAARAAREAMDMLAAADSVHIVIVDPDASYWGNGGEPGADVAAYLSRHGANVIVEQVASGGRPVGDVLEQRAIEANCDMIVMGAYGHSRLRERIFGGVTASVLDGSDFPVFLAR